MAFDYVFDVYVLYVNCVPVGELSDPRDAPSGELSIGSVSSDFDQTFFFNGIIDEVRVWNIVLTQAEIQATMNTPLMDSGTGLVAYWDFNDGEGQSAQDRTGNRNQGQLGSSTGLDESDPSWVVSDAPIGDSN